MFQIKFDAPKGQTWDDLQRRSTEVACRRVALMAQMSLRLPSPALLEWFGTDTDPILLEHIRRMASIITDSSKTVTFMDGRTHDLHVSYNPEDIFEAPTLENQTQPKAEFASTLDAIRSRGAAPPSATKAKMTKATPLGGPRPLAGPQAGGFYGYAFPIDNRGPGANTVTHQGSGFRVYLGTAYFNTPVDSRERAQTIYHELTHKIIGTNDHFYGQDECRRQATAHNAQCLRNADSYGFFVTSLDGYVW